MLVVLFVLCELMFLVFPWSVFTFRPAIYILRHGVDLVDIISISVGHRHGTGYVRKLDQGPGLTVDRFYIRCEWL